MSSLKQTIVDAALRVFHDPKYAEIEFMTPYEARDAFINALVAELFPESPEMPMQEKVEQECVEIPVLEEAMAKLSLEEPKPEPEKKEKKKPGPKAKPKPKEDGQRNFEKDKLNPTQVKKYKAGCTEFGAERDDKALIAYMNSLTPEEYDKTFDQHVKDFLAPKPAGGAGAAAVEEQPKTAQLELEVVEFEGEEYLVDPNTKKVYKENGEVCEHVGDVGLAKFADMEI